MKRFVVRQTATVLEDGIRAYNRFFDPEFARQAAPANLALMESLIQADPNNERLLEMMARSLYDYTFGFLERSYTDLSAKDPDRAERYRARARGHYLRVYELGLKLLRLRGCSITFQKTAMEEIERKAGRLGRKAVPGLVWTAVGAGGAVMMGLDQPWLMGFISKIPILLRRAIALRPGYHRAVAVAAMALYYCRDPMLGGSATKAQRYFTRALALTRRRFLPYLVMYAERWAWQFQQTRFEVVGKGTQARRLAVAPSDKRALFISLLREVKRFPLERAPKMRLANTLAKRWALSLLRKADDFLD